MNSALTESSQLSRALKELRDRWAAVQWTWRDPVAAHFGEAWMRPLVEATEKALRGLATLAELEARWAQESQRFRTDFSGSS